MASVGFVDELLGPSGPVRVAILGSTGSIGRQALDVARTYPDRIQIVALAAARNVEELAAQAREFAVSAVASIAPGVETSRGVKVFTGEDAAADLAREVEAEIILNSVVGSAGLRATLATIESGKTLALANKESLVAAGEVVMAKARPEQIRPVDSEHSALWQLLEGVAGASVRRAIITASGGPFLGKRSADLRSVGVAEALAHPVWEMGRKISIDSATLMNKGLEVIEAHFLFGLTYDEIEVLIHPQAKIHALIETLDGSFFAQAAAPDMRLPIQVALLWPDRGSSVASRLDWSDTELSFEAPDLETFRCLSLAYEAGRRGDTYPAVLNASNEAAVACFLAGELDFLAIPTIVERVMEEHDPTEATLEGVLEADAWSRARAGEIAGALTR